MRKENITAVCTNNEAREYFAGKGLTYDDITEGDILVLVMLLNREIKKAVKDNETSVSTIYLSSKVDMKKKTNGTIVCCYLYVNSHYFTRRECISAKDDWCCYVVAPTRGRAKTLFWNNWGRYCTGAEFTEIRATKIKAADGTAEGVYDKDCAELEALGVRYATEEEAEEFYGTE